MIFDGAGSLAAIAAADTAPASSRFLFSARICGLACARGRKEERDEEKETGGGRKKQMRSEEEWSRTKNNGSESVSMCPMC